MTCRILLPSENVLAVGEQQPQIEKRRANGNHDDEGEQDDKGREVEAGKDENEAADSIEKADESEEGTWCVS